MRIAIGCDHRGLELKRYIIELVTNAGHSFQDFGCYSDEPVDYPDIAKEVAQVVAGRVLGPVPAGRVDQGAQHLVGGPVRVRGPDEGGGG